MTTNYRDGQQHQVGPFTIQFTGLSDRGPTGIATIASANGRSYALDWPLAEAIVFCISPIQDLWNANESDREEQAGDGEAWGWVRVALTEAKAKLKPFLDVLPPATGRRFFPLARLVTDARAGERPVRADGNRTPDYRASALEKEPDIASKGDTRKDFINLCERLARCRNPMLPPDWKARAKAAFAYADGVQELTAKVAAEIAAEDEIASAITATSANEEPA